MSTAPPVDTDLHLPDLRIKGFRGINDLQISRLGRVTLLAGKNGAGKTTVLDAVKVYASRGRYTALVNLLQSRGETVVGLDYDGDEEWAVLVPKWEALIFGRRLEAGSMISVGPANGARVDVFTKLAPVQLRGSSVESEFKDTGLLVQVDFQGFKQEFSALPTDRLGRQVQPPDQSDLPPIIQWESLGPDLPSNSQLAGFWDKVALTDEESRTVRALNLIYSGRVDRVSMIGDIVGSRRSMDRRPVVKLRDEPRPVPLRSLGDGAVRLFGVALALANSKDGFLLIDEAENGIHHSIQRDFWMMILKAAHQNNVQVLATTHSWDCVAGFAMAATEIEEVDGALVRLDRYDDRIRAVEYTEDDLRVAAEQGIEVR